MFSKGSPLILLLLIVTILFSCAQNKNTPRTDLTIDSSIATQVNTQIARFNGKANANISFVVYDNDKPKITNELGEGALTFTSFTDKMLVIDCVNGVNDGFGFSLVIMKDTSFVKFKVLSKNDSTMFKSSRTDALQPELLVNSKTSSVTLAEPPTFTPGEIIEGKVELESEPFYEVANGKERTLRFKISVFFKSEPAPVINNKYKTLVK
jgi:hypothetical protein